jgi:hypothetical protein
MLNAPWDFPRLIPRDVTGLDTLELDERCTCIVGYGNTAPPGQSVRILIMESSMDLDLGNHLFGL